MKLHQIPAVLAVLGALTISGAHAQDPPQRDDGQSTTTEPLAPLPPEEAGDNSRQSPSPAARGLFLGVNPQDQVAEPIQPDTHSLSGAITPGLGSSLGSRRLLDPVFRLSEAVDTGEVLGHTNSITSLGGSLTFDQSWNRYRLTTAYSGTQSFYMPDSFLRRTYHRFDISQEIHWSRWTLLLRDDFLASPEASFGTLFTVAPGQDPALTSLTPALQSSQTILTGRATRLDNTSVAEIDYSLTRRMTLTFSGSYGFLRFSDPGYLGNRVINARAGYDYALSARDSLALIYNYALTRFDGISTTMETHQTQLAYGRKVTGRLSLQLMAGPQLTNVRNSTLSNIRRWSWGLSTSLAYRMSRNTGYNLSYSHGITAGSGVYLGATSDTFSAAADHRFTRFWSATVNGGYARNSNLTPAVGASTRFDNWFVGTTLSRQIGREVRITASYGYQRQTSAAGACPVLSCGLPGVDRHMGGVTLEWHPLAIQSE